MVLDLNDPEDSVLIGSLQGLHLPAAPRMLTSSESSGGF